MKIPEVLVGDRVIGPGCRTFVVAEAGVNHDGRQAQALELVDAAAEAGADAVKFQTFSADRLLICSGDRLAQQAGGHESAYQMFRRLELGFEDFRKLKQRADERGICFLSTPFDESSADLLDSIGVPAFKIASGDLTHEPLLRHVASKGKPVFLSTGMSYLTEIADAVWTLKTCGAREVVLLHCVTSYPAAPHSLNLRSLRTLQAHFELPVGFSDHSGGTLMSLTAAALGASVIEKHFTLNKNLPGPDHKLSLDPSEMSCLVRSLREVEDSLGDGRKVPAEAEKESRSSCRRSIVAAADIRAFETLEPWMLMCKRPGTGLEPRHLESVVGMVARRNLSKDTILQWEDLAPALSFDAGADAVPSPVAPDLAATREGADA